MIIGATKLRVGTCVRAVFLFAIFFVLVGCATTGSVDKASQLERNGKVAAAEAMLLGLAKSGDIAAQANLGAMYGVGKSVKRDYKKSFSWQQKAAKRGHTIAQYNIGVLYARGNGVAKDYKAAAYWFRQAAEAGMPEAQLHMGLMHEKGWGTIRCHYAASKWYYRAGKTFIEQGDLKMARYAQKQIQRLLPDYYLTQQLRDEIFLAGGPRQVGN
ncbi:MAG: tetratricopeptide repeat protein [Acidiferrobacterales bacterium]